MSIFCYLTITAYSQGWLAPMFQRTWGWSPVDYALVNGLVLLAIGPISISLAGIISDKWYQNGRKEAPLIIAIIGTLIVLPTGVMAPLMPSGVSDSSLCYQYSWHNMDVSDRNYGFGKYCSFKYPSANGGILLYDYKFSGIVFRANNGRIY